MATEGADNDQNNSPWMVTVIQTQLNEMAGICNELHRAKREIKFIVPLGATGGIGHAERPTSHIAIFSLPMREG